MFPMFPMFPIFHMFPIFPIFVVFPMFPMFVIFPIFVVFVIFPESTRDETRRRSKAFENVHRSSNVERRASHNARTKRRRSRDFKRRRHRVERVSYVNVIEASRREGETSTFDRSIERDRANEEEI